MASRKTSDLHPDLEVKANQFVAECQRRNIDILITCTYRSNEEQLTLYKQGRETPGRIVTNAKPGESAHNCVNPNGSPSAQAFDVVPLIHGKPQWDATDPVWQTVGEIGKSFGLEWAGDWVKFKEFPHFELPGFKV
ncbi:MAG: M15 family metallopeptidase [Dehalococcoidales bacterium]|nr:M15 family metallopeptidase [Dehalococcoidales bacterium]